MRHIACTLALALVVSGCAGFTYGHGGGLDAQGCHRDSSTGTRHCHSSGGSTGGGGGGGASIDGDVLIIVVGVILGLAAVGLASWAIYDAIGDTSDDDDEDDDERAWDGDTTPAYISSAKRWEAVRCELQDLWYCYDRAWNLAELCEGGDPEACFGAAMHFSKGYGPVSNGKWAWEYFELACQGGFKQGCAAEPESDGECAVGVPSGRQCVRPPQ